MTVGQGARVVVTKTGVIGSSTAIPGVFIFLMLKVSGGGVLDFEHDKIKKTAVEIRSVSVNVAFGGTLRGPYLSIKSPYLNVAFNGTITADKLGYKAGQGPGAGSSVGLTGGSYGGCGGGTTRHYCKVYGTMVRPTKFGSGGGSSVVGSNDGAGGGIIEVDAAKLVIDGMISSSGGSGDNDTTGGGSGGSVHFTVSRQVSCIAFCISCNKTRELKC